jgi:hypothetical protein
MQRKPNATPADVVQIDDQAIEQLSHSANALVALTQEQNALVRATAAQVGYQLPADATDPDLIQRDIAVNMRRSVEACLEVGRGLMVLKAACPHGRFLPRLEVLGLDPSVAQRFIQAAKRLSNAATSQHLVKAIGNQSKLFELLILDDEQIEELALTGQTGELHLDDVARMSLKQLRAALREKSAELVAGEKVREDLSKKLTKLQVEARKKVAADTDWPDALDPLAQQVAAAGRKLATALSELETCRITAFEVGAEIPQEDGAQRAKFEAALGHVAQTYGQAINAALSAVQRHAQVFDKTLAAFLPEE